MTTRNRALHDVIVLHFVTNCRSAANHSPHRSPRPNKPPPARQCRRHSPPQRHNQPQRPSRRQPRHLLLNNRRGKRPSRARRNAAPPCSSRPNIVRRRIEQCRHAITLKRTATPRCVVRHTPSRCLRRAKTNPSDKRRLPPRPRRRR